MHKQVQKHHDRDQSGMFMYLYIESIPKHGQVTGIATGYCIQRYIKQSLHLNFL